jgi:hypothetical protein
MAKAASGRWPGAPGQSGAALLVHGRVRPDGDHAGLRIYGAGIVSSRTESIFALDDPSPNRIGFDLERVMRTPYRIDDFQQAYFVIPSIQTLQGCDPARLRPLYDRLAGASDLGIAEIQRRPGDHRRHPGLCEGPAAGWPRRAADLQAEQIRTPGDAPNDLVGREAAGEGQDDQDRGLQRLGQAQLGQVCAITTIRVWWTR